MEALSDKIKAFLGSGNDYGGAIIKQLAERIGKK